MNDTITVAYDDEGFYDGSDESRLPWTFWADQNIDPHVRDLAAIWVDGTFIVCITYVGQGFGAVDSYDYVYVGADGQYRLLDISENMGIDGVHELGDQPDHVLDVVLKRMQSCFIKDDGATVDTKLLWGNQSSNHKESE